MSIYSAVVVRNKTCDLKLCVCACLSPCFVLLETVLSRFLLLFIIKIVHVVQNNEKKYTRQSKIKETCNKSKHTSIIIRPSP